MKKYLSIGEVSKLKGVSVKSLRYYGELGILPPAYINEKTGYRYYTMEQMIVVDLICICLDLDIPLKNFHRYITENGLWDMEKILDGGKKVAEEKIVRLGRTLGKLESISGHLYVSKEIKKNEGIYTRFFPQRFLLTSEWNSDISDIRSFMEKTTRLYKFCERSNLKFLYNQGLLYYHTKGSVQNWAFIEVAKPTIKTDHVFILPKGEYSCEIFLNENVRLAEEKYIKNKSYTNGSIILARELYDIRIESEPTPVEIQAFVS